MEQMVLVSKAHDDALCVMFPHTVSDNGFALSIHPDGAGSAVSARMYSLWLAQIALSNVFRLVGLVHI